MQYVKYFQCTECGTTYDTAQPMNLCPHDNRPVRLVLDMAQIKQDFKRFARHVRLKEFFAINPSKPTYTMQTINLHCLCPLHLPHFQSHPTHHHPVLFGYTITCHYFTVTDLLQVAPSHKISSTYVLLPPVL